MSITLLVNIHKTTIGDIRVVNFEDFAVFVHETNYITTAEKLQSSTCTDISRAIWPCKESWRNGAFGMPVVHISYRDALAFCDWAGCSLLSIEEYRNIKDDRPIWKHAESSQFSQAVNIIGNVWDIGEQNGEAIIMGGSFSCNEMACRGYLKSDPNFIQFIEKHETANHIGFVVKFDSKQESSFFAKKH